MNATLKSTLLAILILSSHYANADIEVEAKVIEASSDIPVTTDLALLNRLKGVSLLSAPRVTLKPGVKSTIEITRKMTKEGQEPIPFGVEFEITVDQTTSGLSCLATFKFTDFEGFLDSKNTKQPIFKTSTFPFDGTVNDSGPILIDVSSKHDISKKRYIYLTMRKV